MCELLLSYAIYVDSFVSTFPRIKSRVFESGIYPKFAFYLEYLLTSGVAPSARRSALCWFCAGFGIQASA